MARSFPRTTRFHSYRALAGVSEKQIQNAWVNQNHTDFIKQALTSKRKK